MQALVALTWYVNREWMRMKSAAVDPIAQGYTWAAMGLCAAIIRGEVEPTRAGLVGLVYAVLLVLLWNYARRHPETAAGQCLIHLRHLERREIHRAQ